MYHSNRQVLIIAILLGALTVFLLSACGVADTGQASTAVPTAVGATADPATTAAPAVTAASTEDPVATASATTDPAATATTDPAATATADPAATTSPTADPAATTSPTTDPAATPMPTATDDTDPFTGTDELTDTGDLTSTTTLTVSHPVALAIADYFGVPAAEVFAEHQEGQGFGEIARAYFLAQELAADGDPTNDLTADQILAMHQDGMGWGTIVRSLGLPQSNRNRNLGLIMSGRGPKPNVSGDTSTVATPQSQPSQAAKPHGNGGQGNNGNAGNGGGKDHGGNGGKGHGGNGGKGKKHK